MDFFEIFAAGTGDQSGHTYVLLNYTCRHLYRLKAKCKAEMGVQNGSCYTSQKPLHCTLDTIAFCNAVKIGFKQEASLWFCR